MDWNEIAKTVLLAALPWLAWVTWHLRGLRTILDRLMWMHENPEKTGFGTIGITEALSEVARTNRELTHYVAWAAKAQTGQTPPPYVDRG